MNKTDKNLENHRNNTGESPFLSLTDSQWRYITAMVENPSFTKKDAAEHIGLSAATVYEWNKKYPYVEQALEEARKNVHNAALARRRQAVLKAIAVKIALLDSDDESIRSKAATEILEWELGKSPQRTEITGANGGAIQSAQVTIEANNTHDAANILSELASLGAIPSKPRATDNNAETE